MSPLAAGNHPVQLDELLRRRQIPLRAAVTVVLTAPESEDRVQRVLEVSRVIRAKDDRRSRTNSRYRVFTATGGHVMKSIKLAALAVVPILAIAGCGGGSGGGEPTPSEDASISGADKVY